MTADEVNSINRSLGRLEGAVQGLADQWARQEAYAVQLRQKNADKLERLELALDRLATDVLNVQQDIAELKNEAEPMIERAKAEENQRLGRRSLWVALGAVMSAGGALAYKIIHDIVASLPR